MALSDSKIDDAIDAIGFGWYQVPVLIAVGGVYAFTSFIPFTISVTSLALAHAGNLPQRFAALPTSCMFVGYTLGNFFGGYLADRLGRRRPVIFDLASVSCLMAAAAAFFRSFVAWQIMLSAAALGLCMGTGGAAANAGMREWSPRNCRPRIFAACFLGTCLGQLFPASVVVALAPELHPAGIPWRLILVLGAASAAALVAFALVTLPESAQWLYYKGRPEAAYGQLRAAGVADIDPEDVQRPSAWEDDPGTPLHREAEMGIFSGGLLLVTTIFCWLTFTMNAVFYGFLYALPSTLAQVFSGTETTPAMMLFVGALFELPGIALQALFGDMVSRRTNLAAVHGTLMLSMACFAAGLALWPSLVPLGLLCTKVFSSAAFIIVYLSLVESYPTPCRGRGVSCCMTVGRLGAVLAPIAYEECGPHLFYCGLSVMVLISAATSLLLRDLQSKEVR